MTNYIITAENVKNSNKDIFGNWLTKDISINIEQFKHCIIDNFLDESSFNALQNAYPNTPNEEWWKYTNPLEVKFAFDKLDSLNDDVKNIFYALSTQKNT
jgi:hypothetical protein